jgi:uncharacterized damage-inducible protein DinB
MVDYTTRIFSGTLDVERPGSRLLSGRPQILHRRKFMNLDTIALFARYNRGVNETMNGVIKTLSPEEWEKNLGGFFRSVRELCSHLYICDFNWLKRFSKFRSFAALGEPFFDRAPYSFKEVLFEDMNEYLSQRPGLDERMIRFAGEVTAADLEGMLKYTDSSGTVHERNFGGLVMQSFNHGVHHRGMISVYLEILGRENDFGSLVPFIKQK